LTQQVSKIPEWNRYDNIFDVMESQTTEQLNNQFEEAIRGKPDRHPPRIGKAVFHITLGTFLRAVSGKAMRLPLWKIVIPDLDNQMQGAIYYVVNTIEGGTAAGTNHIFRGTFGYWGTGPHESALIEWFLTKIRGGWFEIRNGDYLLSFLEVG
jgi:hypothetical protein